MLTEDPNKFGQGSAFASITGNAKVSMDYSLDFGC